MDYMPEDLEPFSAHIKNYTLYSTDVEFCLKLQCLLDKRNITTPVRGANCLHLECYELQSLLDFFQTQNSQTIQCVKCGKVISKNQLIVDNFLKTIIQKRDYNKNSIIKINKTNCKWEYFEKTATTIMPKIKMTMNIANKFLISNVDMILLPNLKMGAMKLLANETKMISNRRYIEGNICGLISFANIDQLEIQNEKNIYNRYFDFLQANDFLVVFVSIDDLMKNFDLEDKENELLSLRELMAFVNCLISGCSMMWMINDESFSVRYNTERAIKLYDKIYLLACRTLGERNVLLCDNKGEFSEKTVLGRENVFKIFQEEHWIQELSQLFQYNQKLNHNIAFTINESLVSYTRHDEHFCEIPIGSIYKENVIEKLSPVIIDLNFLISTENNVYSHFNSALNETSTTNVIMMELSQLAYYDQFLNVVKINDTFSLPNQFAIVTSRKPILMTNIENLNSPISIKVFEGENENENLKKFISSPLIKPRVKAFMIFLSDTTCEELKVLLREMKTYIVVDESSDIIQSYSDEKNVQFYFFLEKMNIYGANLIRMLLRIVDEISENKAVYDDLISIKHRIPLIDSRITYEVRKKYE